MVWSPAAMQGGTMVQHRAVRCKRANQPFFGETLLPLSPATRPNPPFPKRIVAVDLAHHRGTSTLCVPPKYVPKGSDEK